MDMKKYKVCVVGAGAVGQEMIRLLRKRNFPASEIVIFARTPRTEEIDGEAYEVRATSAEAFDGFDLAFFAGTEGSKGASQLFGWEAVKRGCTVIDNGDDFRMDERVPLVIPEINPEALKAHQGFVANPNCSTIIALMALGPLHRAFGIRHVVASTYQAVSGSGAAAVQELADQARAWVKGEPMQAECYPYPIAFNVLAQIGSPKDGIPSEELKMGRETHKILDPAIRVSCTCVRVPVFNAHSEALHVEFEKPVAPEEARRVLEAAPGVKVVDDIENGIYPLPCEADGQEDVRVGRIRKDAGFENGLALFVAGDNLWKGAALNTIQIGEKMIEMGLV
jgi:aspartate-semialdehyde dehydrogenase